METPIRAEWDKYRAEYVSADVSGIQLRDLQRTFYAGACGVLRAVAFVFMQSGTLGIDAIGAELTAYMEAEFKPDTIQ